MIIKIYDLMKQVDENAEKFVGKKYKIVNGWAYGYGAGKDIVFNSILIEKDGQITGCDGRNLNDEYKKIIDGNYICAFTPDCEIEEVIQEVTPWEALQALTKEGKTIEVHKVNNITKQLRNYKITSDMNNFEFCTDDLKYGKWYIK